MNATAGPGGKPDSSETAPAPVAPVAGDVNCACGGHAAPASSPATVRPSRRQHSSQDEADFVPASEGWSVALGAAIVIFSSWAFGGVIDWTQNWILGLALAGLPLVYLRYREFREFSPWPFVPALLWILFVGLACFNPSHVRAPNGGWVQRMGWRPWLPTTADVDRTLADGRVWLAAMLLAATLTALLNRSFSGRRLWGVLALNGFALAVTGTFFHFSGAKQLLGVMQGPEETYFFATFFYKNHWAAFGALSAICSLALALQATPQALSGDPGARGRALLFAGMGLLTIVTLPLPGSRSGALLAACIALAFVGTALWLIVRSGSASGAVRRWVAVLTFLAGAGIVAFGAQAYAPRAAVDLQRTRQQLNRALDGASLDMRMPVSRDTWRMARERPWFGWGPGCYEIVFPIFQGPYLRRPDGRALARFEFAHNDWLQLLAEAGFTGAALFLVPAAVLGGRNWRRAGTAGRFALGGCALLAAYAWIDFPFHNPAIVMLWVVLLATAHRLGDGPRNRSRATL